MKNKEIINKISSALNTEDDVRVLWTYLEKNKLPYKEALKEKLYFQSPLDILNTIYKRYDNYSPEEVAYAITSGSELDEKLLPHWSSLVPTTKDNIEYQLNNDKDVFEELVYLDREDKPKSEWVYRDETPYWVEKFIEKEYVDVNTYLMEQKNIYDVKEFEKFKEKIKKLSKLIPESDKLLATSSGNVLMDDKYCSKEMKFSDVYTYNNNFEIVPINLLTYKKTLLPILFSKCTDKELKKVENFLKGKKVEIKR